jgi:glycosyltransferase involved in cell wall biosynthesis
MNGPAPLISVILPTLNAARVLDMCLAAIRAQDYPRHRIEIVMADAGSTDGTLDIAARHGVDRIVPNPLRTGEAGKAAAIDASSGDILALVDSDNILDDPSFFSRAAALFHDDTVDAVETPLLDGRTSDSMVNRYCALLGMNDPIAYFLGSYNRYSHLSGRFTGMPLRSCAETPNAFIVEVDPAHVPSFGANGFLVRRRAIEGLAWSPYYFDIDVFQQMTAAGRGRIAVMKTGIRNLYCDTAAVFRRKQARRIRDYLHHARGNRRTYSYTAIPKSRYVLFVLATVTVLPLLLQSLQGYLRKPDRAWWFHPAACWITLGEYGWGVLRSLAGTAEYDRKGWKQ